MLELDVVLHELAKLHVKEKSLRRRLALEQAISSLRQYQQLTKEN